MLSTDRIHDSRSYIESIGKIDYIYISEDDEIDIIDIINNLIMITHR